LTSSSDAGIAQQYSGRIGGLHPPSFEYGTVRILDAPVAERTISFARGAPSADILPHVAVREAAAHALESDWEKALSYGTGRGHPGLCEWIADMHGVETEQVMVTNGSMEAAALLFRHLVSAGDRVVVEQPTYDRTLLLLRQAGADIIGAPLEADGVDPAAVESATAGGDVKLAHIIPNFHNPAGCTLSPEKRSALVQLAANSDFLLFEDDPYRLICFEEARGKTMLELDAADRVIHASSFSKSVSPGVRVGYLVGPAEQIATMAKRANETYISPNMLAESIVFELCRSGGLDENLKVVNAALRDRRDALVEALREHIPEAEFVVPEGGYFLWLDLHDDVDTTALLAEAKEEGVTFVAGPDFMIEGGSSSLRLSFAPVPAEYVAEGVQRLARALDQLRSGSRPDAEAA
jgi:DNA-binding transcriptional MocR family regulator